MLNQRCVNTNAHLFEGSNTIKKIDFSILRIEMQYTTPICEKQLGIFALLVSKMMDAGGFACFK
jgi:hypothetical protein